MPDKRPAKKKTKKTSVTSRSKGPGKISRVHVLPPEEVSKLIEEFNKDSFKDGDDFGPYPIRRNPEPPPEETEKMRAARKALTLRAFRMAYDNHRRKDS